MPNAVERLFNEILSKLPAHTLEVFPDWPDVPVDEIDQDYLDEPPHDDDDRLLPLRDERTRERAADVLMGDTSPTGLSPEDSELVEGAVRVKGFDALAFYKSKRFEHKRPYPGKWGIFFLKQGLLHIATEIEAAYPAYKDPRRLAHDFLYAHEHFHFRADLQTLMFEAVTQRHLYIPLRNALRGRRSQFVEEALANREALVWAKQSRVGVEEFAEDFMDLQPNAYARYREPVATLAGEWLANTLDLQPPRCLPRSDVTQWVAATPKELMRKSLCPQYVVYPRRLETWLDPAWVPPPVTRVNDGKNVEKMLLSKYRNVQEKWQLTKKKLIENRLLRGLNFKPWGENSYSVRVDDNFRAHLRNQGGGVWEAYEIGPHKKMGHG
jgi:hypothetical protein